MEDNKLKEEIIAITGNVFPKDSIVYKELYSLTAAISIEYGLWRCKTVRKGKTENELFEHFITHIYQPR